MSQFEYKGRRKALKLFTKVPTTIEQENRSLPATWYFSDGSSCEGSCIACSTEPCRLISTNELIVDSVPSFSRDASRFFCPVRAIGWDDTNEVAVVDEDACFGCGLCVARCPVGAISIGNGVASVSTIHEHAADPILESKPFEGSREKQQKQIRSLPALKASAPIQEDAAVVAISRWLEQSSEIIQKYTVRSVLVAGGNSVSLSRRGDVHTRMDGVYSNENGEVGSLEIEFGSDTLEALRATLDDIAVLHCRFDVKKDTQNPLVVLASLPRERQGYWQVVSDVLNVLSIQVKTVTIAALLLLIWNGHKVEKNAIQGLTPRFGDTSIRNEIEKVMRRPVVLDEGIGGILEPEK